MGGRASAGKQKYVCSEIDRNHQSSYPAAISQPIATCARFSFNVVQCNRSAAAPQLRVFGSTVWSRLYPLETSKWLLNLLSNAVPMHTAPNAEKTTLREPAAPLASDVGVVEGVSEAESFDKEAMVRSVHQLEDILRRPISDELLRKVCFSEMLLVCDGSETIVGGAAISVSLIAEEVLAAFSSTRLTFLGHSTAESELMSFADRNCRPLQERKCETLFSGTTRQEKQIQLYFDEAHNVTAYRQESNGLRTESFHGMLSGPDGKAADNSDMRQTILPDGLQLLLLRYLVLSNFVGEICSQTIDVQGRVGNCIHKIAAAVPVPKSRRQSNASEEAVKEVRKTTWYSDGTVPEESVSHYDSTTGRLLRHGWNGSNYILIANPLGKTAPTGLMDLARSMQDYVQALSSVIKNRASVKEFLDDVHCSVKEMERCKNIVNPVLIDIINEI
ncbi:uncharacterized protein LOC118512029 isoform X2 [Anopheles stephensi]|uniref:uncharacterized protein LOC118512029 isoform X2 n=1 Tax=Anopheles stephensi TaxID=30069 RepID=UPI001658BE1D|nr:uncharacterized protein LOC118512029 isoform X2 [Anopheles stephensi]